MDINLKIKENKYNLNIDKVLGIAKRDNNPKRNFLFVTTLLGKCLISNADVCRSTGYLLGELLTNKDVFNKDIIIEAINKNQSSPQLKAELEKSIDVDENIFIMGFAETATGLGMSVASSIKNSYYIQTSRENIKDMSSIFDFEEEHSHATTHKCYLKDIENLKHADRIVLVDDEITTGNTCLNLIKELKKITMVKNFSILTIFDWRKDDYYDIYKEFQDKYDVNIDVHSLVSGSVTPLNNNTYIHDNDVREFEEILPIKVDDTFNHYTHITPYGSKQFVSTSGLFGVSYQEIRLLDKKCKDLAELIKREHAGKKILILGHGENIYIPSRVASFMSTGLNIQTTTRSPLMTGENDVIKDRLKFEFEGVVYYLYNTTEIIDNYDLAVMITDSSLNLKLLDNMITYNI